MSKTGMLDGIRRYGGSENFLGGRLVCACCVVEWGGNHCHCLHIGVVENRFNL